MIFVFLFICIVDYIDRFSNVVMDYLNRFSYVEQSLHLWNEVNLIMVDNFFDVFFWWFASFSEYFCINVHEVDWSVILFLRWVLVWFVYQDNCNIMKRVWQCSFWFFCMEQFEEYTCEFFFEVLGEFCTETSWSCIFFCMEDI